MTAQMTKGGRAPRAEPTTKTTTDATGRPQEQGKAEPTTNEVRLVGRVSGMPEAREMPSGDEVVQLRLVIRRPPVKKPASRGAATAGDAKTAGAAAGPRVQVDTIDVACWSATTRRAARRVVEGDVIEVQGALRRRFYRAGAATVSRYEVEAARVRRCS